MCERDVKKIVKEFTNLVVGQMRAILVSALRKIQGVMRVRNSGNLGSATDSVN